MAKKLLELFAGSRSVGKQAEKLGMSVLSVDKFITDNINLVIDIQELTKEMIIDILGYPDIIWASPVCSAWSKTGWFHYWDTDIYKLTYQFIPKKDFATESIMMIKKTIEIFSWFPNAVFYMENPEGMLAFHPVINYFKVYHLPVRKHLVTYCQYGDTIRKPTNIWTNNFDWIPKRACKNGDKCHVSSPRCTQNGIYTKKGNYERSKIPLLLCQEVLTQLPDTAKAGRQKINYGQVELNLFTKNESSTCN